MDEILERIASALERVARALESGEPSGAGETEDPLLDEGSTEDEVPTKKELVDVVREKLESGVDRDKVLKTLKKHGGDRPSEVPDEKRKACITAIGKLK